MTEQTGRREIVPWVDLVRVVAIYLVVLAHVSGQLTDVWGEVPAAQWSIANLYGSIARACVPLFFMLSGYLLLPRSESLGTLFTKRMPKLVIPLIVWSVIYLDWYCGNHPNTCTLPVIWDLLLVKGAYYHLWFLYSLISIYLILPVLRLMIRPETDRRILWYLIVLWLIFQPLLTFASKFWNFNINIRAPLATSFVCYFILGYLLGEVTLSRSRIMLSAIVWAASTLGTVAGTYLLTRSSGKFDGFFYDFVSLSVIPASAAAFILLRWAAETRLFESPGAHATLRILAISAFGIYLIHPIFIEILNGWLPFLQISSFMGNAIWSVPLTSIVVFLVSFLAVFIIQKIPVLKSITP